jgi:hypothetical protein
MNGKNAAAGAYADSAAAGGVKEAIEPGISPISYDAPSGEHLSIRLAPLPDDSNLTLRKGRRKRVRENALDATEVE